MVQIINPCGMVGIKMAVLRCVDVVTRNAHFSEIRYTLQIQNNTTLLTSKGANVK
jgi:hypothetical protein